MPEIKCFIISLHRTGTRSTIDLLRHLGMTTAHYDTVFDGTDLQADCEGHETDQGYIVELLRPLIDSVDAASDVPFPTLYRRLASDYPNARFILLYRDPVDWALSVRRHIGHRQFHPFERVQYWHYFPTKPNCVTDISFWSLINMHIRHLTEAALFFEKSAANRFMAAPLDSPETASAIVHFLGCGHAEFAPMPHRKGKKKNSTLQLKLLKVAAPFFRLAIRLNSRISYPLGPTWIV